MVASSSFREVLIVDKIIIKSAICHYDRDNLYKYEGDNLLRSVTSSPQDELVCSCNVYTFFGSVMCNACWSLVVHLG